MAERLIVGKQKKNNKKKYPHKVCRVVILVTLISRPPWHEPSYFVIKSGDSGKANQTASSSH